MAVFLTIVLTAAVVSQQYSGVSFILMFIQQMGLGAVFGYLVGKLLILVIKKTHFEYEGLYPVLTIAGITLTYAVTAYLGGSGFLAVYMAGLILGKEDFIHKRVLLHFHEGIAWLMQIAMFLTLGLLVFPSQLKGVIGTGLLISLALIVYCTAVKRIHISYFQ